MTSVLFVLSNYLLLSVDKFLFLLMTLYDKLVYSPLQTQLSPMVACIPRYIEMRGKKITIFTANGVTLGRTILVVPVAICLKSHHYISASLFIVLHDFLDHLDGIVAKVHRRQYGLVDSPILGSFLDAFCDKVVNVFSLWTIMILCDYQSFTWFHLLAFVSVCSATIGYEIVLGVVRVQDFFATSSSAPQAIQASLEGKTKEKLESMSLAFFCLSLRHLNPLKSWWGIAGCTCLAISLRFAHGSLMHKLTARTRVAKEKLYDGEWGSFSSKAPAHTNKKVYIPHISSVPDMTCFARCSIPESFSGHDEESLKVDKVYTVGCFDLFHRGHEILLKRMRKLGKEVIVGVHNDESYFKLKQKRPIDNTEKRMKNVKKYAHQVFVVSSTDPSPYIRCCVHLNPGERALYVRGDDMPQFPGRHVCEEIMPIRLLPYTQGVSSTMLRVQLLSSNNSATSEICQKGH